MLCVYWNVHCNVHTGLRDAKFIRLIFEWICVCARCEHDNRIRKMPWIHTGYFGCIIIGSGSDRVSVSCVSMVDYRLSSYSNAHSQDDVYFSVQLTRDATLFTRITNDANYISLYLSVCLKCALHWIRSLHKRTHAFPFSTASRRSAQPCSRMLRWPTDPNSRPRTTDNKEKPNREEKKTTLHAAGLLLSSSPSTPSLSLCDAGVDMLTCVRSVRHAFGIVCVTLPFDFPARRVINSTTMVRNNFRCWCASPGRHRRRRCRCWFAVCRSRPHRMQQTCCMLRKIYVCVCFAQCGCVSECVACSSASSRRSV